MASGKALKPNVIERTVAMENKIQILDTYMYILISKVTPTFSYWPETN